MRVLIVDDEALARDSIRTALADEPAIEIVGECEDGPAAVEAITALEPDLVFLDIRMPGLDAFELIDQIGASGMPGVVFVSAYDEHAVRAFEVHAFDYVLKPFEDARLVRAVREARQRLKLQEHVAVARRLASLLRELDDDPAADDIVTNGVGPDARVQRILVRDKEVVSFVDVSRIAWIAAAGNYVRLHLDDGTTHLVRTTIADLEARLDPARFLRIHRSTILNLNRLQEVHPLAGGDHIAVLDEGQELRVSRTYRKALLKPML